jgi:hypothetical protein
MKEEFRGFVRSIQLITQGAAQVIVETVSEQMKSLQHLHPLCVSSQLCDWIPFSQRFAEASLINPADLGLHPGKPSVFILEHLDIPGLGIEVSQFSVLASHQLSL